MRAQRGGLALLLGLVLGVAACGGGSRPPADAGVDAPRVCVPATATEQACDDEQDDDCDGFVDCVDVDCSSSPSCVAPCVPTPEDSVAACTNGLDDDCDESVDCADDSCLAPGLFACIGAAWRSRCVSPLTGSQTMTTSGVELLLTGSGVSGTAAHDTSGMFADILTVGATASTAFVDLVAPPNDNRDTCTHCFLLRRGAKSYFVRNADVQLSQLPSAVGEPFAAVLQGSFEEVVVVDQRVVPVPAGECLVLTWTITGTAVSSVDSLGLAGAGALTTTGTASRSGQTSGDPVCEGNGRVINEDPGCECASVPLDRCPGGHACPRGSTCLTQGRCECDGGMTALTCDAGAACGVSASCDAGSAWSCVRLGCGVENYTVPCGDGLCPSNSTCQDDQCVCDPGYEYVPCDEPVGTGMCQYIPIAGCPGGEQGCPDIAGRFCPSGSSCLLDAYACACDPGTVAVSCDGIRCSEENYCGSNDWACAPDALIP